MLNASSLAGKKVMVTGAGGFLGQHLVPLLHANGARVTAFVHKNLPPGLPKEIQISKGDCGNQEDIAQAVQGQEIVIHMAGLLFGSGWQDYLEANHAFAANLAQATQDGGQRVIFISSLAAAGPAAEAPGKSETDPPAPVSAYGWSKLLAERTLAAKLGERLTILRPPIIYGSKDKGLLPLFKSCKRGFGLSPGRRPFPVSLIHADDASRAVLLLCQPKATGVYHIDDGHIYEMSDLCRAIGKALGQDKVTVLKPPLFLMGLAAAISQMAHQLWKSARSRPPAWNRDKFREAQQEGWLADGGRLRKELGFRPGLDLASGLAETIQGYQEDGWL